MMHREKERTNERRRGTSISLNETRDLRKPKSTDMRFLAYVNMCTKERRRAEKPRNTNTKNYIYIYTYTHASCIFTYLPHLIISIRTYEYIHAD